jgi:hypothetical protein
MQQKLDYKVHPFDSSNKVTRYYNIRKYVEGEKIGWIDTDEGLNQGSDSYAYTQVHVYTKGIVSATIAKVFVTYYVEFKDRR